MTCSGAFGASHCASGCPRCHAWSGRITGLSATHLPDAARRQWTPPAATMGTHSARSRWCWASYPRSVDEPRRSSCLRFFARLTLSAQVGQRLPAVSLVQSRQGRSGGISWTPQLDGAARERWASYLPTRRARGVPASHGRGRPSRSGRERSGGARRPSWSERPGDRRSGRRPRGRRRRSVGGRAVRQAGASDDPLRYDDPGRISVRRVATLGDGLSPARRTGKPRPDRLGAWLRTHVIRWHRCSLTALSKSKGATRSARRGRPACDPRRPAAVAPLLESRPSTGPHWVCDVHAHAHGVAQVCSS